jgi:hypothetical protein
VVTYFAHIGRRDIGAEWKSLPGQGISVSGLNIELFDNQAHREENPATVS